MVADLITLIGTIDIVFGEIDKMMLKSIEVNLFKHSSLMQKYNDVVMISDKNHRGLCNLVRGLKQPWAFSTGKSVCLLQGS